MQRRIQFGARKTPLEGKGGGRGSDSWSRAIPNSPSVGGGNDGGGGVCGRLTTGTARRGVGGATSLLDLVVWGDEGRPYAYAGDCEDGGID